MVHRLSATSPEPVKGPRRHIDRLARLFESTWSRAKTSRDVAFLQGREYDLASTASACCASAFAVASDLLSARLRSLARWRHLHADHFSTARKAFLLRAGTADFLPRLAFRRAAQSSFRHVAYVSNFSRDRERQRGPSCRRSLIISRGHRVPAG